MFIPKNHEKLQVISEIIADGYGKLEQDGVPYYDDRVFGLAQQAIRDCMPELVRMSGEVMTIEASRGVSLEDTDSRSFNGLHVSGTFERASIQQLIEAAMFEEASLDMSTLDLCAVITPRYVDPDPQDIIFGKELYVPFSSITAFEPAEK